MPKSKTIVDQPRRHQGPIGEPDAFGNGALTEAHRINAVMSDIGQTIAHIDSRASIGDAERVRSHMYYLRKKGFAKQVDGQWLLTKSGMSKWRKSSVELRSAKIIQGDGARVGLLGTLVQFGFDVNWTAKMARHKDTRRGIKFDALINSDQFEEYQAWQGGPVFHNCDIVVSFVGDGPGRARLWGVYRVLGHKLVPYKKLSKQVPWPWRQETAHYRYELERLPDYEPLEDQLVIEWTGERKWTQRLKDNTVLERPRMHDIDLPVWSAMFAEGQAFTRLVTSRKRSREARETCLNIHGCRCEVCEMTFPEKYGGLGERFMHVHHRTGFANNSGEVKIDPKKDLHPVCPNCHAMLHWGTDEPRGIEELRKIIGK